jgi:hypothetical protein
MKLRLMVSLLFCFRCLLAADTPAVDLKDYVQGGGSVGEQVAAFGRPPAKDRRPTWSPANSQSSSRSKGRYTFGEIKIGELVRRSQAGVVVDEWIDFDLEVPRANAQPQAPVPKSGAGNQTAAAPQDNGKGAMLVRLLTEKLGQTTAVYSSPGDKSSIGHTVMTRKAPGLIKHALMWRLQLFYANDNQFLIGKAPFYARLQISLPLSPEELIFSRNLFMMKPEELLERLSLAGITANTTKAISLPDKLFGSAVSVKVIAKLGRLQSVELKFLGDLEARGIVMKRSQSDFMNKAYEALSSKIRSYPVELRKYDRSTISTTQTIYDQVSGGYYTYTDEYQVSTEDYKLVWSPRGAPNYRLVGKTLQILPPGLEITKALDPTAARLASGNDEGMGIELPDFNLPVLDFSDYKGNVQRDRQGGFWLDIPMEDQGELNFCAPASLARIMRYYGRQVNQFGMAIAGGVDMRGTDWAKMSKMFGKCSQKFGMIITEPKPGVSLAMFVKSRIDNGQPLLWLVPGHARIINGYNPRTGAIYYTDSWGPGFELESMPYDEALKLTEFVFAFLPQGVLK